MTLLNRLLLASLLLGCFVSWASCGYGAKPADEMALPEPFPKLLPLHTRLGKPQRGEWLAEHPELGQTYQQYLRSRPVVPDNKRRVIYVQPLGDFTPTQRKIISLTAEYMHVYFDLPVKTQEDLPLKLIPASARRKHPSWGMNQILSTYVLDSVLAPRLPKDAMASIAFTASDLWPGEGWNFVFGQASLSDRVGVWSIYRNGDPEAGDEGFRLCLVRTLKVATHETGHMFSMQHCTLFECNMCGSNHLVESDRHPLWLCPHCMAKLCWATGADPKRQLERLAAFSKGNGLKKEREFYEKSLEAIGSN
jgi:archaemetzincin